MKSEPLIVTPEFVDQLMRTGPLAKAIGRAVLGTALPLNRANWEKLSTWQLICEEILDTEHDDSWLDDIVAELGRRGFSHAQIQGLRRLAWQTAGWLNYECRLWNWCNLDQDDMRRALQLQRKIGLISESEQAARLEVIEHPELCPGESAGGA